jgi:capsule polysaccharide modification protein KpsS
MCNPVANNKISEDTNILKIVNKIKNLKKIIIPKKDASHFLNPFNKIFNLINIARFFEKLFKKFFLNIQYDFDEIFRYSLSFLKNLINYFFLYFFYSRVIKKNRVYHYFPLHVPNDFALTLRSPIYLNQIDLIKRLLKKIPKNEFLYIKEHPARIGALNFIDAFKILRKYNNLKILYPSINSYEILENCKSAITINSKTGYEALIMNKPLFVFGESYYKKLSFVSYCNLNNINLNRTKNITQNMLNEFFKKLYYKTFDGQLYHLEKKNINIFVKSINNLKI